MSRLLTVDAGRTTCRIAVVADGEVVDRTAVANRGSLLHPGGDELIAQAILDGVSELGTAAAGCTGICAGLAGAWGRWSRQEAFARSLSARLGATHVVLTNDVVTAYMGALGAAPGVVLVAGTGAIALGLGPDGTTVRADGWGYLLGDEGSGHWVGREGLRLAMAAYDGRNPPTLLQSLAKERFGELERLPAVLASDPDATRTVAEFAIDVVAAAEAEDTVAIGVLQTGATALATTIRAAGAGTHGKREPIDVAAVGGLLVPPVRALLADELARMAPKSRLVSARGDALQGAAGIAETHTSPFDDLIYRFEYQPGGATAAGGRRTRT